MLNRWVLSREQKTATEGAEVTRSGRLVQMRAVATGKAWSEKFSKNFRKMFCYNTFSILFLIPSILCFVFMLDVPVFVRQQKMVQYIVLIESIFPSCCITVRPALYLCLGPAIL